MAFPTTQNAKPERVLVSWKEIAAFLNRAERTVKRWERERGLPVHRVPGGERPGVYAYPSELAGWLKGKSSELEADDLSTSDQETSGASESGALSEEKVDAQPIETALGSSGMGSGRRVRLAVIGLAAALAGAGFYANFAYPFGNWIHRRLPAIPGIHPVPGSEVSVAHDLYLNGRFEWSQRTPESLNRALDDFTQAIVHNPNDARAYAGLADSYEMLFIYGSRQDDDARDKAMAAARKAVELNGSLSEAHRALGYAEWRSGNFGEAERELHLAIQLDPKEPLAHLWLSNVLANEGKTGDCLAEINKAQELDPASASILAVKGDRLYWMGRKEEGLALLNEALRSEPKLGIAHWYLAAIAYDRKDYPLYLKESETTAEIRDDAWLRDVTAKLSVAFARDGERGLLKAEFAVQESCSPPAYQVFRLSKTKKAFECLKQQRKPEALRLLEEANANQEKEFEDFRTRLDSDYPVDLQRLAYQLADDPRFQALIKQKARPPKQSKLASLAGSGTL